MLKGLYSKITNNSVLKNILILLTGTGLTQLIPIINSLFLARLYTKSEYGELSVFMSIVGILGLIVALRYELAIIQIKKENEARNVLILSLIVSLIVGGICFLVLSIEKNFISTRLGVSSHILFLCPFVIVCIGVYNILYNWFNRKRLYKNIVKAITIQSLTIAILRLSLGLIGVQNGLVYGIVGGYILVVFYFLYQYYIDSERKIRYSFNISKRKIQKLAFEYRDFAIYSTSGDLFNSLSNIGFPLLITYFYSLEVSGLYFFANNFIRLPLSLLSASISQVYKKEASVMYNKARNELFAFTFEIQKIIFYFLFPILLIFTFWGAEILFFIFGERWMEAGNYIKYFSVFVLFNSLYAPISSIMDILRKQRFMLFFNMLLIFFQIILFYFLNSISFGYVLLIVSCVSSCFYIFLCIYVRNILKKWLVIRTSINHYKIENE